MLRPVANRKVGRSIFSKIRFHFNRFHFHFLGKTWNAALPLFVYGSLIMIGYRLSLNIGPVFNPDGRPPIRTSTLEPLGKFRWGNESKIVKLDTEGPVWKQFVDQDKK